MKANENEGWHVMYEITLRRAFRFLATVASIWIFLPLVFAGVLGIGRSSSQKEERRQEQRQQEKPERRNENGGSRVENGRSRGGVFSGFVSGYARGLRAGRNYETTGAVDVTPEQRRQIEETRPVTREDQEKQQGRGIVGFGKELKTEFDKDEVPMVAQALSYTTFLALFPFFIFLAALSGFVAEMLDIVDPTQQILDRLTGVLPSAAATVISEQIGSVLESTNGGLMTIGALGALWATAGAMRALMKAMNKAYDVPESRPFIRKYIVSLGLALFFSAFLIAAAVLMFAGQIWGRDILEWMGVTDGWAATLVAWAQWPIVAFILLLGVALLYWAAPNIDIPFKLVTPGAVAFVVGWIVATMGFVFYVSNFSSYNATYGALGGVVIMLIWIFLSSLILLVGAEINAMTSERAEPEVMEERRRRKKIEAEAKGQA